MARPSSSGATSSGSTPSARNAAFVDAGPLNLGDPDVYRVPDRGYHRAPPTATWVSTAAVVVGIVSPDHETYDKFGFYADHGINELIVADPAARTVTCWARDGATCRGPRVPQCWASRRGGSSTALAGPERAEPSNNSSNELGPTRREWTEQRRREPGKDLIARAATHSATGCQGPLNPQVLGSNPRGGAPTESQVLAHMSRTVTADECLARCLTLRT
jgi:hypothetical protein